MPANPIALVTTEWVAEHLADADVVVAEVDEDASAYQASHIPGAVGFDWRGDFQDPLRRTFLGPAGFAHLMERAGITNGHQVVLYGGSNNWFAAYAYWYFTIYGHNRVSLMDGGRKRWEMQHRQLTSTKTERLATQGYQTKDPDVRLRALRDQILSRFVGAPAGTALVDVRSPAAYRGRSWPPSICRASRPWWPATSPGPSTSPGATPSTRHRGTSPRRRASSDLRRPGHHPRQGGGRLLPYRRARAHTWFVLPGRSTGLES
jgi:thiosulfate/3-mercaptopyruvate sulfurtransferase